MNKRTKVLPQITSLARTRRDCVKEWPAQTRIVNVGVASRCYSGFVPAIRLNVSHISAKFRNVTDNTGYSPGISLFQQRPHPRLLRAAE